MVKALVAQFPALQSMGQGQQAQQPNALQGYTWPGVTFFQGQGQAPFSNLSPFEGAKGSGAESITGGLALGTYGKSSSQQPAGGAQQPFTLGQLNLPSLQLPQAVASQQGAGGEDLGGMTGGAPSSGGTTIGISDILGAGQEALNLFSPGTGTAFDPTGQTKTPAYQEQRAGERVDYSNATGSPSGLPQGLNLGALTSTLTPTQSLPSGTTFSTDMSGYGVTPSSLQTQYSLPSDTTFSMPGAGETLFAPGSPADLGMASPTADWMNAAM